MCSLLVPRRTAPPDSSLTGDVPDTALGPVTRCDYPDGGRSSASAMRSRTGTATATSSARQT